MTLVSKHALRAGVASAVLLATVNGFAQSATQSSAELLADLRACSTLERDGARLACFDGVLAAQGSAGAAAESAERSAPRAPRAAPARPAEAGPESASATVPEQRLAAAPQATRDAAPPRAERAEQREQPEQEDGPRTVTIVEINAVRPGEASFLTETGELYIQTSGSTPRGGYPELPYETSLRDGAFGSLFLYLGERQRIRVRAAE